MGLLSLFSNLIARFRKDGNFIIYNVNNIGQKGEIYIDTQAPGDAYNTIAQYKTVIDKGAALFSNAEVILEDKNGNKIEDSAFYELFNKPNPLQTFNEYLKNIYAQYRVYGNQFQYINKPSAVSQWPVTMWNMSPLFTKPVATGKIFDQVDKTGIISGFKYKEGNNTKMVDPQNMIWMKIADIDDPLVGKSPIYALQYPLSNTKLAYQFRNVIMSNKGALGILRPRAEKDAHGGILPVGKKERQKHEEEFRNSYGIQDGKMKTLFGNWEWQAISFPTKDYMLFEEVDDGMLVIIDSEGLNANIFAKAKATYENVKNGMIASYQDAIIPFADQVAQAWTEQLCSKKPGLKIRLSYDHVSILKADKTKDIDNFVKQANSLIQLFNNGLIDGLAVQNILAPALMITQQEMQVKGNEIVRALAKLSPLVANNVLGNLKIDEVRNLVGLEALPNGEGQRLASMATETNVTAQV